MDRIFVILALIAGVALIGFALFFPGSPTSSTDGGELQTSAEFSMENRSFNPDRVTLRHGRVRFELTNNSNVLHQIELYDPVQDQVVHQEDTIRPGQTVTFWVDLRGGVIGERRYRLYDPTFRRQGMEAIVIVR